MLVATPDSDSPTSDQVAQAVNVAIHGSKARVTLHAQMSGHNSTVSTAAPSDRSGWWTRARKIGAVVVGLSTVVAAVAAVLVLF